MKSPVQHETVSRRREPGTGGCVERGIEEGCYITGMHVRVVGMCYKVRYQLVR